MGDEIGGGLFALGVLTFLNHVGQIQEEAEAKEEGEHDRRWYADDHIAILPHWFFP